jgi:hypothetical protein
MSINTILTPADLAGNDIVPGWYPAEIIKYEEAPSKTDQSTNCIFFFKIIGDGPAKGRELRRYFNEKVMFFGRNLWITLGFVSKEKGGSLTSQMLESSVGKKLSIYIKKDKDGKFDTVEDFKPLV